MRYAFYRFHIAEDVWFSNSYSAAIRPDGRLHLEEYAITAYYYEDPP